MRLEAFIFGVMVVAVVAMSAMAWVLLYMR
jgi:hypothetical protein